MLLLQHYLGTLAQRTMRIFHQLAQRLLRKRNITPMRLEQAQQSQAARSSVLIHFSMRFLKSNHLTGGNKHGRDMGKSQWL